MLVDSATLLSYRDYSAIFSGSWGEGVCSFVLGVSVSNPFVIIISIDRNNFEMLELHMDPSNHYTTFIDPLLVARETQTRLAFQ